MRIQTIEKRLKTVPILKELENEEIHHIYNISQTRFYKQKINVFMQGDPLENVYFIHSGKIKIYKGDSSRGEQIISVLEAGAMFPYAGFFRRGSYPVNAKVMEDAQLIVVPIEELEQVLLSNPVMCIKLFKVLGDRIVELQKRLEEQILHDTHDRIIMLLLRLCKTNGVKHNEFYKLTTHFTNRELASMIGTTRESVCRTINDLKKKGFITFDEKGSLLINRKVLQQEIH